MPLDKQIITLNFSQGIDTKTDPKQVMPGDFTYLYNSVFQVGGRLTKRNGFTRLGTNSSLTVGNSIAAYKNELAIMDGSTVNSYAASTNSTTAKGTKIAVDSSLTSINKNAYSQFNMDMAYHSGTNLYCHVWQDSSGSYRYSVIDGATGEALVGNGLILDYSANLTGYISNNSNIRVKVVGAYFVILYSDIASSLSAPPLKYVSINTATPTTLSSATTIDAGYSLIFDALLISTRLFFVWLSTTGALKLAYLDSSLALSSILTIAGLTATQSASLGTDASNNVWVAYLTSSSARYLIRDFNLSGVAVLAPTVIETVSSDPKHISFSVTGSTGTFYYELEGYDGDGPNNLVRQNTGTLTGTVGSASDFLRSVMLASKPFLISSTYYVLLFHDSSEQPMYFLADSSAQVVAKSLQGVGSFQQVSVPAAASISASVVKIPLGQVFRTSAQDGTVIGSRGVAAIQYTFGGNIKTATIANDLHLTGGILSMYDGKSTVEHSFHLYPEDLEAQPVYGGSGLGIGSYQYFGVYEWVDNQGQVHRSAPSTALDVEFPSDPIKATGDVTNGSPTIANLSNLSVGIAKGMTVVGNNIPANTTIIQVNSDLTLTMSANATGTAATQNLSFEMGYSFVASTSANGTTITPTYAEYSPIYFCDISNGSAQVYVYNPAGLAVGMTMLDRFDGAYTFTISAINGNVITASVASTETGTRVSFVAAVQATGDTANGNPTITNVSAAVTALLFTGQVIYSSQFAGGTTVLSKTSTTVTLSANASATTTGSTHRWGISSGSQLTPGQILSSADVLASGTKVASITQTGAQLSAVIEPAALQTQASADIDLTEVGGARILFPTLRLTAKTGAAGPVVLALYRTLLNGSVAYRLGSFLTPTINDTTDDYIYFYDYTPDAEIEGNEQLYTTGGELENIAAPAVNYVTLYKNRMMVIYAEDPLTFGYSKQVIPGSPVEFSDLFAIRVDERDGGLKAAVQMDDKFILWKQNSVFYMVGNGPTPAGTNNDFSEPLLIVSDCGCVDPKSIVVMPLGVMFKSNKGIYILKRDLSVDYLGAKVESYNSDVVTSAVLIEKVQQVRFTMQSGVILCYDYFFNQWSVFTGLSAVDSCSFQNYQTYLASNGRFYQETAGTYSDNGTAILMSFQVAWLSLAQIQGFQRIYNLLLLGEYFSAHTLTIDFDYDFSVDATSQTVTIPVTEDPAPYQFRAFLPKQKCEALRFSVTETQSGSPGQGFNLSSLAMEVGVKKGVNKIKAARSYGS